MHNLHNLSHNGPFLLHSLSLKFHYVYLIIKLSIYWSYLWQVEEKYRVYKERLEQAIALVEGKAAVNSSAAEEKPPLHDSSETCLQ